MYYDALSRNTVKITLTEQDMHAYSIKKDSIVRRNAETKRTLTRFLKKFQSENSVFAEMNADRLFLEAFPAKDGGCVLYVSALGMENFASGTDKTGESRVMCILSCLSDAIKLCRSVSAIVTDSALYRLQGTYFLTVSAKKNSAAAVTHIMLEYGSISTEPTDMAFAAEHGHAVCQSGAAKKLSELS